MMKQNILIILLFVSISHQICEGLPSITVSGGAILEAKCEGQDIKSLKVLPCVSPQDCDELTNCLKTNGNCGDDPFEQENCTWDQTHKNCVKVETIEFHALSGVATCTDARNGKNIQLFTRSTGGNWQNGFNYTYFYDLTITQERRTIHHAPLVLYVGEQVKIECNAAPYLFQPKMKIEGLFQNGTKFLIGHQDFDDNDWYWSHSIEEFKILKDMAGFTCSLPWYNSTENWFEATHNFKSRVPTPIVMQGDTQLSFTNCGEAKLNLKYTGGPADLPIIFFHPENKKSKPEEVFTYSTATRHVYSDREELEVKLDNYDARGDGVYVCHVGNSLGNSSAKIETKIRDIHGATEQVIQALERNTRNGPCLAGEFPEKRTGNCYKVGEKGGCGELMKFNTFSLTNGNLEGECGCQGLIDGKCPNDHFKILFWEKQGRCYQRHTQGPCETPEILDERHNYEISKTFVVCQIDPDTYLHG